MDDPSNTQTRPIRMDALLLPALALLPAFLGGGTERWSQGLVLVALGLLLTVRPPRFALGPPFKWISLGLLACVYACFLPAKWFGIPTWRTIATRDFGIDLGPTITTQPIVTLETSVLIIAGLLWFHYVASESLGAGQPLPRKSNSRRRAVIASLSTAPNRDRLAVFSGLITLFAAASLYLFWAKIPWPFPSAHYQFGPFPNRNQTGDLLAMGSILLIARVHDYVRHGRKRWMAWSCAAAIVLTALVLSFSRAAIVLCFAGVIVWILCLATIRTSGVRLAIGAGVVLILWSAFLFGGGETLKRFLPSEMGGNESSSSIAQDLRWNIQKDALTLGNASPVTGIGVGNFESQFWQFHDNLGNANYRVLHPESDWIWLRVEMGWLAVGLVFAGIVLIVPRVLPLGKDPRWRMRAAAAAAVLLFLLHGGVDVSAHRMGTVFPALFICAMALLPGSRVRAASPWSSWVFQIGGILLAGIGALWTFASWTSMILPGRIGLDLLKKQIAHCKKERDFERTITLSSEALAWAPLDWELYHARAVARAVSKPEIKDALADFRRARFLNPVTPEIPFNEGAIWLVRCPALTLPAWQDALRRAGETRPELYGLMLSAAANNAAVRAGLKDFAQGDPSLMLLFMGQAKDSEFRSDLAALLKSDPELYTFSPLQRQKLFASWSARTDPSAFLTAVEPHERWLPDAWSYIANAYAGQGHFKEAVTLVHRSLPTATIPKITVIQALGTLEREHYLNPGDFTRGYALYDGQMRMARSKDALATLQKFTPRKGCPPYFFVLEAALLAETEKWRDAWETLKRGGLLEPRAAH